MRQPARRSKAARKPQGKPRVRLRRELRPARSRRTSAAHEASIAHIGSTARNDLNSRSRRLLNAQSPLHRLYLEHWTRRRLDWLRGSAWASVQTGPACTGPHLHGEQAAEKTRATGADQARRLLRNRKKRCSQMLQRKGTMPMLRNRKSNSRRCDLRMSGSWHFGHRNSHSRQSPENLWPGEVDVPMAASAAFRAARPCKSQGHSAARGCTNMMHPHHEFAIWQDNLR